MIAMDRPTRTAKRADAALRVLAVADDRRGGGPNLCAQLARPVPDDGYLTQALEGPPGVIEGLTGLDRGVREAGQVPDDDAYDKAYDQPERDPDDHDAVPGPYVVGA